MEQLRLQKIMADSGVGSRRFCEILITSGRVSVNDEKVTELGSRAALDDEIRVDGVLLLKREKTLVVALNKPVGVISAMSDEKKRHLGQFVADYSERLFHVGRLDEMTEGLIILTNDGALAQRLSHPKFEVQKTYMAKVTGKVEPRVIRQLLDGVELEDGHIKCDRAILKGNSDQSSLVEVVIHSGRNRIVRRMMSEVGHPVERLIRTHIGGLGLDSLAPGQSRELSDLEIKSLSQDFDC
jgi:23S rRNA pseudouridine2605 synthase/16S rRNA pseudouridine516 synthase